MWPAQLADRACAARQGGDLNLSLRSLAMVVLQGDMQHEKVGVLVYSLFSI